MKHSNFLHTDVVAGKNQSGFYGRAFASLLMDFDGNENQSELRFDFDEVSDRLQKMNRDDLVYPPKEFELTNIVTLLLKVIIDIYSLNYCGENSSYPPGRNRSISLT